jgi:hypothetical protein
LKGSANDWNRNQRETNDNGRGQTLSLLHKEYPMTMTQILLAALTTYLSEYLVVGTVWLGELSWQLSDVVLG